MKVAAIQMTQGSGAGANVEKALRLVEEASSGVSFVALPECFAGYGPETQWRELAEQGEAILARLGSAARRLGVHLLAGSVLLPSPERGKCLNTSALIGPGGDETARYVKKHLFDVELAHRRYRESDWVTPGGRAVTAAVDGWTVGFSICFDLRFPAHFAELRRMGAEVILAPSAFSHETGKDHWLTLIRARAIETQCYLIAPALEGECAIDKKCFGSTAIVDPWGDILGLLETGDGFVTAELDRGRVEEIRRRIPMG